MPASNSTSLLVHTHGIAQTDQTYMWTSDDKYQMKKKYNCHLDILRMLLMAYHAFWLHKWKSTSILMANRGFLEGGGVGKHLAPCLWWSVTSSVVLWWFFSDGVFTFKPRRRIFVSSLFFVIVLYDFFFSVMSENSARCLISFISTGVAKFVRPVTSRISSWDFSSECD